MRGRIKTLITSAVLVVPFLAVPALAAGDGGGGGGSDGASNTSCPKGKVYDKKSNSCKDAQRGAVDDDSLYEYGRGLAEAGRYAEAITILSLAADKTDPRILNYPGYSHRKAGRVVVALGYYQEALRQNPDYTLVREYLGEAYLQQGDVKAARGQLAEIEKRCGKGCREYVLLSDQIDAHVKG
ncbi:MAG: tetratricopeptide repeat protein [Mesorhizobium sp.]|nr:tetratricopeptide repeat protein [Mesorhizobium sp.]MBL8577068.1 tetratricopeptide repeat protein [Mesorhizobium sp.]